MLQKTPDQSLENLTDAELLRQFVDQTDRAALEEIVRRHRVLVFGICWRVLGHWQDAEDAFQGTFAVLANSAAKIKKQTSLSCWLHGVAFRVSMKMINNSNRWKATPSDLTTQASEEESPLEQIARRNDEEIIDEELHNLPEKFRAAMILRYLESYTNQQIAEELRLSVTAVEARLKRGRSRLRQQLTKRGVTLATFGSILAMSPTLACSAGNAAGTATEAALASEALIQATVDVGMNFGTGNISGELISHQIAQMEIASMTLTTVTKCAAIAGTLFITASVGWLGMQGNAQAEGNAGGTSQGLSTTQEVSGGTPAAEIQHTVAQGDSGGAGITGGEADAFGETGIAGDVTEAGDSGGFNSVDTEKKKTSVTPREKIQKALAEKIKFDFFETPLSEAISTIGDQHNLPILIEESALEAIGVQLDTPITQALTEISLASVMEIILEPLELDYILKNEVLTITSRENADRYMETKVYWLDGLDVTAENLAEILQQTVEVGSWMQNTGTVPGGEGFGGGSGGGAGHFGGPGSLKAIIGNREGLVVSQSQRVHRKIEELLDQFKTRPAPRVGSTMGSPGTNPMISTGTTQMPGVTTQAETGMVGGPGPGMLSSKPRPKNRIEKSLAIPQGMRVVTVPITVTEANAKLFRPGDVVDVKAAFEAHLTPASPAQTVVSPVLERAKIFAINSTVATKNSRLKTLHVSLLLSPEQAGLVLLASKRGTLHMTLQKPQDSTSGEKIPDDSGF